MINHGKKVVSENYYNGDVVGVTVEIEQQHFTEKEQLLKDFIDCVRVLTSGQSRKLTIEIGIDKQNRYKITQRYVVEQE